MADPTSTEILAAIARAEADGLTVEAKHPYYRVTGPTVARGGLLFGPNQLISFASALDLL